VAALAAEEASPALRNASEAIRDEEKADREWDKRARIKEAECKKQAEFGRAVKSVSANSEKEKHKK
jgi:hypothetical protein